MSIGPEIWGPHGWKFIHYIAFAYPIEPTENDKQKYKTFFSILGSVLPCSICKEHYEENLKKYPLTDTVLKNKINLTLWTIDLHNEVNKLSNKKIYDYDTAIDLIKNNYLIYENFKKTISLKKVKENDDEDTTTSATATTTSATTTTTPATTTTTPATTTTPPATTTTPPATTTTTSAAKPTTKPATNPSSSISLIIGVFIFIIFIIVNIILLIWLIKYKKN